MRFRAGFARVGAVEGQDSLEWHNCHAAEPMDISRQSQRAANAHQRSLFTGQKTCIACHNGIAHRLPKGAYDFGMTQEAATLRDFLDQRQN
jgi:cytochrome c-type protein NapC